MASRLLGMIGSDVRPTPREELEGIRRILAEGIAPAVSGEHAAAQLQGILAAIARRATRLVISPIMDHPFAREDSCAA